MTARSRYADAGPQRSLPGFADLAHRPALASAIGVSAQIVAVDYQSSVSVEDGVANFVQWYRDYYAT